MNPVAHWARITAALATLAFAAPPVAAHQEPNDGFAIYEDWTTADHIRSDRWNQSSDVAHDARAEVKDRLLLRYRREASAARDTGTAIFSNRLAFANPAAIDRIEAELTVTHVGVQGCPANPTAGEARAAAIDFVKFSDLDPTVSRTPGSLEGDYFARVLVARRSDSTDPEGTLSVLGVIFRCNDAGCVNATRIQTASLGQVTVGHPFRLRLIWDPAASEFRTRLNRGQDVALPYPAALNQRAPNVPFGTVRIQHIVPNCTPAGGGPIEADAETKVGTVKTNVSAVIP